MSCLWQFQWIHLSRWQMRHFWLQWLYRYLQQVQKHEDLLVKYEIFHIFSLKCVNSENLKSKMMSLLLTILSTTTYIFLLLSILFLYSLSPWWFEEDRRMFIVHGKFDFNEKSWMFKFKNTESTYTCLFLQFENEAM